MASKTIGTVLNLKDKFSPAIKKTSNNTRKFNNQLKHTSNSVKKFGKVTKNNFKSIAKSAIGLGAAYIGIRKGIELGKESANLARAQIEAETKLKTVLKQRTGATDKQIKSIYKLTSSQQQLGVIGDEVQIAGLQQLGTFVKQTGTVKTLLPAMNNLLAQQKGYNATQGDAVNVGNLMGKVLNGQVGALSRVGISFNKAQEKVLKYGTEQEKAKVLAQVITDNVGDMNKELASTDQGKIQQTTNTLGDMKEELGKRILPLQARFAGWFMTTLPKVKGKIKAIVKVISPIVNRIKDIIKNAIQKIKKTILRLKDITIKVFDIVKPIVLDIKNKILKLRDSILELAGKILKDLQPVIERIKDNVLPALKDALNLVKDTIKKVLDIATDTFNFISKNWETIKPLVLGIAGAWLTYKGVMFAFTLVTKGAAIAQWALNVAMNANPIGIIITGIGLLVGAGILLAKNWDTVKAKASELWEGIKNAFAPVGEFFGNVFGGIKDGLKSAINFVIRGINGLTKGLNKIHFKTPDWIPGIGGKEFGFNIKPIPEFALGTHYFKGGLARTDERGGEIKQYPNGTKIYPHDESVKMAREEGRKESDGLNITVIVQGNMVGNESFANEVGCIIWNKIKTAKAITV
ncbi:hypothetical protein AN1V17_11830 [Vallitalea sediminicola]